MTLPYQYTPYIWPMLASAVFAFALGLYCWRQRRVPGAFPLAIVMLFCALWAVGAALELAASDAEIKIFWFKFVYAACLMPVVIARLCFVMQYAGLGRWLSRRILSLLAIPIFLQFILALTNESHHLIWRGFTVDEAVTPLLGIVPWFLTVFAYLVLVLAMGILAWLFFRSPPHRWPVALILYSMLTTNTMYLLDAAHINPFAPLDLTVLSMGFGFSLYVVALFGFRMFDPIPMARQVAITQMRDGMLVLDGQGRVVSLNSSAERILGEAAKQIKGKPVRELLAGCPDEPVADRGEVEIELSLQEGQDARHYTLAISPLKDWREGVIGHLLLLHDVTAQKRAQAQLLEQQKVVSALHEREQLARELHDSIGQVLGYVGLQADAARKLYHDGQDAQADTQLVRLSAIARDAHADVREYIFNLRSGPFPNQPFLPTLREYLESFSMQYNLQTELSVDDGLDEQSFEPDARLHIFRIIQEALSNARKHASAHKVQVSFEKENHLVRLIIRDDGLGFDMKQMPSDGKRHFGVDFMRERAELLGGCLQIESAPGKGTRVIVEVPLM